MKNRVLNARLAVMAGLLALAACAQPEPFQPREGHSSGYTDERLGATRYRVTYTGSYSTSRETLENYLLLRAAQVTLQSGYQWFVFDTRDTEPRTTYHTDFMGWPGWPGAHGRFGWYWHDWDYADSYPRTRYDAYAEIIMLTPEQAHGDPRALDANDVVRRLTPPPPPPPPPAH